MGIWVDEDSIEDKTSSVIEDIPVYPKRKKHGFRNFIIVVLILALIGGGGYYIWKETDWLDKTITTVMSLFDKSSIQIKNRTLELVAGESSKKLDISIPEYVKNSDVIWSSSDSSIANVDENGVVTPVSAGEVTITASYGSAISTCKVTVKGPNVESIEISKLPNKTEYYCNDKIDLSGLLLSVEYSDGTKKSIDSGYACSIEEFTESGEQIVVIDYANKTASFSVNVNQLVVNSISIETLPTRLEYYKGESLVTEGLSLKLTYNNGKTEIVSEGFTCTPTSLLTAGKQNITVTYQNKSDSFSVTVSNVVVESMSIKALPNKTSYYTGDSIDVAGLTLIAKYNNGEEKEVTSGFTCSPSKFTSSGTQTVTVEYGGKKETFTVNVTKLSVTSVSIASLPTKISYYVGDTLKDSGLSLIVTYNNGDSKVITSGFDCSPSTFSSSGTKTVMVSYGGKSATFNVSVDNVKVSRISISNYPNKMQYYVDDKLDTSGMKVLVEYNNGKTETIKSGFDCSPTVFTSKGSKTVTVEYKGSKTSFNVTVSEAEIVNVSIYSGPNKTEYYIDERLDTSGLSLIVTYSNGEQEIIKNGYSCDITKLSTTGTQSVRVSYEGFSTYFSVYVKKKNITVYLNANGGYCNISTLQAIMNESVGTLPTPSRDYYNFDGWYTSSSGGNKVTSSSKLSADTTIYAHWTEKPESGWVESIPSGGLKTAEKTQYSYRDKSTTTSSSNSKSGWTWYDSEVSYGSWKDVGWTANKPTESNTLRITNTKTVTDSEEKTKYTYVYYHYYGVYNGAMHNSYGDWNGYYKGYEEITLSEPLSSSGTVDGWTMYKYKNSSGNGNVWFFKTKITDVTPAKTHTEWFYQTRTEVTTHYFYKWGDWTSYSDNVAYSSDTREVRTRSLYKYREK